MNKAHLNKQIAVRAILCTYIICACSLFSSSAFSAEDMNDKPTVSIPCELVAYMLNDFAKQVPLSDLHTPSDLVKLFSDEIEKYDASYYYFKDLAEGASLAKFYLNTYDQVSSHLSAMAMLAMKETTLSNCQLHAEFQRSIKFIDDVANKRQWHGVSIFSESFPYNVVFKATDIYRLWSIVSVEYLSAGPCWNNDMKEIISDDDVIVVAVNEKKGMSIPASAFSGAYSEVTESNPISINFVVGESQRERINILLWPLTASSLNLTEDSMNERHSLQGILDTITAAQEKISHMRKSIIATRHMLGNY